MRNEINQLFEKCITVKSENYLNYDVSTLI